MKKWIIILVLLAFFVQPVYATEFTAPTAPETAQPYMPEEQETFAQGLWYIIKSAIQVTMPNLSSALSTCLCLIASVLFISIMGNFTKSSANSIRLIGAVAIGIILLKPVNSFIQLGADTVVSLSEYGRLLLPVMTAALAAQGGTTTSATLYTATVFFDNLLTSLVAKIVIPGLYIFLCLCVASSAVEQDMLEKVKNLVKQVLTWCLKAVLYLFTGYLSITGVISGAVDASALKAAKMTLSGAVPVVGGILSNASETILISAGIMKNAAGVYGIFTILAICVSPFLQIGVQYLLLKATGSLCQMFGYKPAVSLIDDFSSGMGFALAMTGTVCFLLLISIVCFMKGMG